MNDELKVLSRGLVLNLRWPTGHDSSADEQNVVVELRFATDPTLITVSIPCNQLLQAVEQRLSHYPMISQDGFVSVFSEDISPGVPDGNTVPIDQLVAEAISPEMLEDEPEAAQMLSKFRDRLLKSLEHLDQAIASLPND